MSKFVTLHGFGGSGGSGLNFEIVGGTTQPTNPTENMIWVNTDVEISSWVFSVDQPNSPAPGMVWFKIGTFSNVSFDALKENNIQIHPLVAKQYIDDNFINVTVATYLNNEWTDWRTYLYKTGNQCVNITGGWSAYDGAGGTTTFQPTYIQGVTDGSDERYATPFTVKKIDVTNYSKLIAEVNDKQDTAGGLYMILASSITGYKTFTSVTSVSASSLGEQTIELDISAITGEYQVMFYQWRSSYTVTNVWLE